MTKKIKFMMTGFRDGFQSAYGARVLTKDFLPAVEAAKNAGIEHFEAGGGARFQSLYFYCNEDAFTMMDKFRETAGPNANLQTLARGTNVVGLESQSSDIINLHAKLFKKHGITTIRNFDALNDVNNLIYSGKCIKDAGLKHEVCVTLMSLAPGWDKTGKTHTPKFYANTLKQILDAGIGFDSVCFKDASGTTSPKVVAETISLARKMLPPETEITFHTHETAGTGVSCYLEAVKAGADRIDLSMAPVSGGTCQPDIITMWHALRGTDFTLDVDIKKIVEAENVFKDCMKDYFMPPEAVAVEPLIPFAPMPGGALTANTQMMRDNKIMHRYQEVFEAMGETVRRGGFGTSVTPVSQFYFQQAFNNVMMGPWKKIAPGYGKMVLGYFGKTPIAPDKEIVKIASEQLKLEPTTKTPLEINDADKTKGIEHAKKLLEKNKLKISDENIFITATCGDKGIAFLKGEAKENIRKISADQPKKKVGKSETYTVTLEGETYVVSVNGKKATVNGTDFGFDIAEGGTPQTQQESVGDKTKGAGHPIKAPMPGTIFKIIANNGEKVEEGQTVLIMEAMKMETEIKATKSGSVKNVVSVGQQVQAGDELVIIK